LAQAIDDVDLIIFDCDGVVADSEPLATRALQEALRRKGLELSLDEIIERFLGRSTDTLTRVLRTDFGIDLNADDFAAMRAHLFALFERDLKPVAGVKSLLRRLTLPYCLASSSQPDRIETTLRATGCAAFFVGRIFSAVLVKNGKPAPDLFLYAAAALGAPPERCVVIEDSPAGIEAAKRANMRVIAFLGGGHASNANHRRAVADQAPHYTANHMSEVEALLGAAVAA
jgi:HAD superfamily hydrolase (TIGR01509 family)